MARNDTTWKPGQSGNPRGRPKKQRALTEILSRQGSRTLEDVDGKRRSGKRIVARALWEIATTGATVLPGGKALKVSPADWIGIVQWLYKHIDGPPKTEMELTSGGEPFVRIFRNVNAHEPVEDTG